MDKVILIPTALALFTIGWNVIWGPTPKGTPWGVFMRRLLWVAFGVWAIAFAVLGLTWKGMQ